MGITDIPRKDHAVNLAGIALADLAVPTGREEEWRFTPLKRLRGLHELTSAPATTIFQVSAAPGVTVSTGAVDATHYAPADRIAAAALQLSAGATIIEVAPELVVSDPIVISANSDQLSVGHLRIRVGQHSRCTLILDITGSGTQATTVELLAEDGAQVTFAHIADGDRDQVLSGQDHIRLGRDATVQHVAVTLGGDLVRLVTTCAYEQQGGDFEALGVFFTDSGQHHEHRLFVDHATPHCSSNVAYKGALQGDGAHAVWIGDVLIRAAAEGTRTYEMNRNLVLTTGARADSVPNLEIETGNVISAGHASATGRFDEEQMFYLLSRGIPEVEAKRLVVRGFINDLVQRIPIAELRERLLRRVETRLGSHDPRYDFDDEGNSAE